MAFVLALLVFAAAIWFLRRLKQRDVADCAAVLGLPPAGDHRSSRGTTPEGFAFYQRAVLDGSLLGRPAALWSRTVRHPRRARSRRHRGGEFTILELTLERPVRTAIRLQPAGVLSTLEGWIQGEASDLVAIEPRFDAAYVTHAGSATAALLVLTPPLREKILAFRAQVPGAPPRPADGALAAGAGALASGLVLGTFHLHDTTAAYALHGSPTKATAAHVRAAAPLLLELAAAAGGGHEPLAASAPGAAAFP